MRSVRLLRRPRASIRCGLLGSLLSASVLFGQSGVFLHLPAQISLSAKSGTAINESQQLIHPNGLPVVAYFNNGLKRRVVANVNHVGSHSGSHAGFCQCFHIVGRHLCRHDDSFRRGPVLVWDGFLNSFHAIDSLHSSRFSTANHHRSSERRKLRPRPNIARRSDYDWWINPRAWDGRRA
jgi:hypothetical protein